MEKPQDSFTFTVGKLDAGMAILLGERAHLIEFPSVLLPPGASTGSIVSIAVHQNHEEEKRRDAEFWSLQDEILKEFGVNIPVHPKLQLRNVTQTSVTLEWPSIQLATAKLRSLDIYRNGQRLAAIPSPTTNTSTKLSGLEINTEYSFQLILRTTAGTFPSNLIRTRTHTMTDTSGICVCFGNVQDEVMLENAKLALREMKAKWSDKIQIDTTHFVCTTPASGNAGGAPGVEYQRALQLSIPVVQPHWILACHAEKKMIPIASYYLGATPATPTGSTSLHRLQSMSQPSSANAPTSPPPNKAKGPSNRASMPAPASSTSPNDLADTSRTEIKSRSAYFEPTLEDEEAEDMQLEGTTGVGGSESTRKIRAGTMNKEFKFPSQASPPATSGDAGKEGPERKLTKSPPSTDDHELEQAPPVIAPTSIEVPPPPPVEKERSTSSTTDDGEDDVGDVVDIPLN